ncbi:formin-binding protein HOF1 [Aspergillus undulatus]|uniref:formin-binding protein HOF1 n=1 Tax=Aspergillus undulatus TaxID=1810928 RepID=UPI003CCD5DD2
MPGTVADGPTVALSFANNFWGKDDAGVAPMLERMHASKTSCDELKTFYNIRAAIEDEYARKLLTLCRKPLGANESGSLRASFDTVRRETEAIAKAHAAIAGQMKRELEEPLMAFAGGNKERRKIIQNGIERIHKTKMQQTQTVNKTRDRYEQDCLRIKGYLAQGHMVMGHEERKNKAKLEKTQIQLASSSSEYDAAIKVLVDTTSRWNKEWKSACDKFQDLEEERIDFTKSSLWTYANIASTVCVSDDASCEKIRLSLESCEVEKDIVSFIKEKGTGQEIPDAPKFINFSRGDVNDASSDVSEEEGYSVAQFQRTINPAFRSSSPQPSTYESHHEPEPAPVMSAQNGPSTPASRETTVTPQKPTQPPMQPMQQQQQPPPLDLRRGGQLPPNYDPNQHGEIAAIPHNAYPTDGMTMFCRTGPPSERSAGSASGYRPSSRDSQSELSNVTSMSSQEPTSARQSPTKPTNGVALPGLGGGDTPPVQKKKFFSNSPFRRKSRHDKDRNSGPSQLPTRRTWDSPSKQTSPIKAPTPQRPQQISPISPATDNVQRSASPEPVDPRANFQLNVGNNVFDVASPDKNKPQAGAQPAKDGEDPIARALADLKVAGGKPSTTRVSADRYHGIATPAPSAPSSNYNANSVATPPPAYNDPSVKRLGAPQPAFTSKQMQKTTQAYTGKTQSMLRGKVNPASMSTRSPRQSQEAPRAASPIAPGRSASPQPAQQPAPQAQPQAQPPRGGSRMSQYSRAASPNPGGYQTSSVKSRYSQSPTVSTPPQRPSDGPYSPHDFAKRGSTSAAPSPTTATAPGSASPKEFAKRSSQTSTRAVSPQPQFRQQNSVPRAVSPNDFAKRSSQNSMPRAVSPQPQFRQQTRPSSAGGMELQLSQPEMYGGSENGYGSPSRASSRRPMSYYEGESQRSRSRSRSMAVADPGQQFSRDGRPILHFARALYSYTAAIPEELGFTKGDVLSVIRLQDDGWWEAEVTTTRMRTGLVPSNYLQII